MWIKILYVELIGLFEITIKEVERLGLIRCSLVSFLGVIQLILLLLRYQQKLYGLIIFVQLVRPKTWWYSIKGKTFSARRRFQLILLLLKCRQNWHGLVTFFYLVNPKTCWCSVEEKSFSARRRFENDPTMMHNESWKMNSEYVVDNKKWTV